MSACRDNYYDYPVTWNSNTKTWNSYSGVLAESSLAVITFKNTSKEALDMSEEELMERFTRGDSSRHTEGNGLGLSIARSLAELQNGHLSISLDGDLFKAILSFPLVDKETASVIEKQNGTE